METIHIWMERRLSRRGFLATSAKVAGALGLAMVGAHRLALTAHAACCINGACANCLPISPSQCGAPLTNGCPFGCSALGGATFCCDTGTNTCHACYPCKCNGVACDCECDTAITCGTGGPC
jgi:hypothetical protein